MWRLPRREEDTTPVSSPRCGGDRVALTASDRKLLRHWPDNLALNSLMTFERWYEGVRLRHPTLQPLQEHPVDVWLRLNVATNGGKGPPPPSPTTSGREFQMTVAGDAPP